MIIDFHTHTFPDRIAVRVVDGLARAARTHAYTDGTVGDLLRHMREVGIDYAVNLPVMTRADQVAKVNRSLAMRSEELLAQGVITFGGMHPDCEDWRSELDFLAASGVSGIKLHPAYQGRRLDDPAYLRIIEHASELGMIVVTHAGVDIGVPGENWASVPQIISVIEKVHPRRLVLAHLGNWACWDEFESDLAGAPVYIDTAFSMGPIEGLSGCEPPMRTENLPVEDAVRIMRSHGIERVLFATDSPWADMAAYVRMLQQSSLTAQEQERVFCGNARHLLAEAGAMRCVRAGVLPHRVAQNCVDDCATL